MSTRCGLILVWMVAGLQVLSVGQNPPPENPPSQTPVDDNSRTAPAAPLSAVAGMQEEGGADDTGNTLPQIPALLGGIGISPAFLSEMERSNYLRAGLNVSATYDDNPLLLSSGQSSNTSESIFPNIKIDQTTSRMHWTLGYAGGLTVNQKFTSQNQGSHNVIFDSRYRLSPHVNLRVAENFSLTTGFFDAGNEVGGIANSGGPNESLITPLATQRSSVTTVETNYHFALNDLIGASGSFYDLHFTNVPVGTQLTDSQTATGTAFWLHKLFGADWGGITYRFDRLTSNVGDSETRVHSFFVVDTLSLSKRLTLTGFVGPQYSENQGLAPNGLPPAPNAWLVAGGAEGSWKNQNTAVLIGYSRTVSDGGGLLGAVRLQNVYGNFRLQLAPGWATAVNFNRGSNQALTLPPSSITLTSAGISLERNVGKSFGFRMGYSHDFQQESGQPGPIPSFDASRNRVFVTLSYQWAKPLGM
jgi:hypothetical protein